MKKVLAVDMDGVLAQFLERLVELNNEFEEESVSVDDIKCWGIHKYVSSGKRIYDYLTYDFFRTLNPMKDSVEIMGKLNESYNLFIVTSATNSKNSLVAKMEWLAEHFPFIPATNIVLCGSKSIIKCDILIDDSPRNLSDVSDAYGILFDAPHNHNHEKDRFTRVMNWNEIEKILLPNEEE